MCPLILLLFIAIIRRILDYGITENRYFVLVMALWILGNTLYLLLSKKKLTKVLPISLFVLAILISFGPWGAFSTSKKSQVHQFKKVFSKIREHNSLASTNQYEQLESILHFLYDRRSISGLDPITKIDLERALKDSLGASGSSYGYMSSGKVLDSLGISLDPDSLPENEYNNYHYYNGPYGETHSQSIVHFDYFASFALNDYDMDRAETGKYGIVFQKLRNELLLSEKTDSVPFLSISLKPTLVSLGRHPNNLNEVDKRELVLDTGNDSIQARLIFTELGFYQKGDSVALNNAKILLFLKHQ
jgi:hypothetical protein